MNTPVTIGWLEWPPLVYSTEAGEIKGIFIQIINEIAKTCWKNKSIIYTTKYSTVDDMELSVGKEMILLPYMSVPDSGLSETRNPPAAEVYVPLMESQGSFLLYKDKWRFFDTNIGLILSYWKFLLLLVSATAWAGLFIWLLVG